MSEARILKAWHARARWHGHNLPAGATVAELRATYGALPAKWLMPQRLQPKPRMVTVEATEPAINAPVTKRGIWGWLCDDWP